MNEIGKETMTRVRQKERNDYSEVEYVRREEYLGGRYCINGVWSAALVSRCPAQSEWHHTPTGKSNLVLAYT